MGNEERRHAATGKNGTYDGGLMVRRRYGVSLKGGISSKELNRRWRSGVDRVTEL